MKRGNQNYFLLIINALSSAFMCIILFWLFFNVKGSFDKLVMLPFLLCGNCLFWQSIAKIIGNYKLVEFFRKLYVLIFLIYWFGIIGTGIYSSVLNKDYSMIFFIIPFIIVGVYVSYKFLVKKK